jgi:hypothetical protein
MWCDFNLEEGSLGELFMDILVCLCHLSGGNERIVRFDNLDASSIICLPQQAVYDVAITRATTQRELAQQ